MTIGLWTLLSKLRKSVHARAGWLRIRLRRGRREILPEAKIKDILKTTEDTVIFRGKIRNTLNPN